MKVFSILFCFIVMLLFGISGCSSSDNWRGYIYPDKDHLTEDVFIGEFDSLESCRARALSELEKINALDSGDYECGLNCRKDDYGLEVCKETLR